MRHSRQPLPALGLFGLILWANLCGACFGLEDSPLGTLTSELGTVSREARCLRIVVDNALHKQLEPPAAGITFVLGKFQPGEHVVQLEGHQQPCGALGPKVSPKWITEKTKVRLTAGQKTHLPLVLKEEKKEEKGKEKEREKKAAVPTTEGIVVLGSSSIVAWKTLEEEMAPLPIIRYGVVGSTMKDAISYIDRQVLPHKPKIVLLYEGDNDIISGITPAAILAHFQSFVQKVHQSLPQTKVIALSIKPSPSSWGLWEKSKETNALLKEYVQGNPLAGFIDISSSLLTDEGQPRPELYSDGLHLNEEGYRLWCKVLKPLLQEEFKARGGQLLPQESAPDIPLLSP
jgi:lysophospholipase L1-like esterase